MSKLIAVSGKGGVGKTTVAALLVRHLLRRELTPVFAVDADPNYTLGEALGIEVEQTIGTMREQFFGDRLEIPAGMSREAVLERNMHATLMESKGLDLLVMGRQEGPGCYCYLNNILRRFLDTLAADYRYVVVDNEAGMEHLSRRTTRKVDLMLVVADHSVKGARAARRIEELADELELSIGHRALLLNRVSDGVAPEVRAEVERSQLELLAELPPDEGIAAADAKGQPLVELPADNPFIQALDEALQRVLAKI
jgi:CO dehydrogenase maturation factor